MKKPYLFRLIAVMAMFLMSMRAPLSAARGGELFTPAMTEVTAPQPRPLPIDSLVPIEPVPVKPIATRALPTPVLNPDDVFRVNVWVRHGTGTEGDPGTGYDGVGVVMRNPDSDINFRSGVTDNNGLVTMSYKRSEFTADPIRNRWLIMITTQFETRPIIKYINKGEDAEITIWIPIPSETVDRY